MAARTSSLRATFLSTLSLRRATITRKSEKTLVSYFYPRSPCGERLEQFEKRDAAMKISIHALLAESDCYFATGETGTAFSIHALLAESDGSCTCFGSVLRHFYPRSPCGERLKMVWAEL